MPFLYYILAGPLIVFCKVAEFIGDFISGSPWKPRPRPPSNLARIRLEEVIEARRELRDYKYKSQRQLEEAQKKFREELKRKERESNLQHS